MYKIRKTMKKFITCIIMIAIITCMIPANQEIEAASKSIKVRYNGKTVNFTGQQVYAKLDGETIDMDNTPGLEMNSTYMVSYIDVFKKALGASCSYNKKTKSITIKKYNKKIVLKVGSKRATVNGKKYTLDVAPVQVRYISAKKTKILVPARFVATNLGYEYSWVNNSSVMGTITMKKPFMLKYDGAWTKYTQTQAALTLNDKTIKLSAIPGIKIDNSYMIPANAFVTDSKVGGTYQYDKTKNTITVTKGDKTIVFTLNKKTATVNGKSYTLSTAPRQIYNEKTKKTVRVVPANFLITKLGYNYNWNSGSKTIEASKKNTTYFTWKSEDVQYGNGDQENEENKEQDVSLLKQITASYKDKKDIIKLSYDEDVSVDVESESQYVNVKLSNASWTGSDLTKSIEDGYWISRVALNVTGSSITIKIRKQSGTKVSYESTDDSTEIIVSSASTGNSDTVKKNGIVIAVDCGHGLNTAGKRTPPMPCDIDFDGDGVIDVKKGNSIREYQGNLGVGTYLVKELERCGFTVIKSAFNGIDTSLSARQSLIKSNKADYSISVHFNAAGDGKSFNSASGVEVLYHSSYAKDSKKMAQTVLKEMVKGTSQVNRGVKQQALALCNTSDMNTKASILVECAFMTNLYEAKFLFGSSKFWKETAQDIARGVCEYTGQTYVKE